MDDVVLGFLIIATLVILWITFVDTGNSYGRSYIRGAVNYPMGLIHVQVSPPTPSGQTVAVASAPAAADGSTPANAPAPVAAVANTPQAATTAAVQEYMSNLSGVGFQAQRRMNR
jgi:hypothetical protein